FSWSRLKAPVWSPREMYEVPPPPKRRRLLWGSSCAVGVAAIALSAYWFIAPSVRARATTAPEIVSVITTPAPAAPAGAPPPTPQGWPASVSGRVRDEEGRPLAGASVVADGKEIRADAEGAFTLGPLPPTAPLVVKLPGYEKVTIAPTPAAIDVTLRRKVVKAAYLTYYGFADRQIRTRVLDLVGRTELNAVVIDIKGDRGWIPYRTEVPEALAV